MHTNLPIIGRIYHVVRQDGRVIKVGSTIQPLRARARGYKKKYSDCFLREAFTIESSTADDNWYGEIGVHQPKKAFCPFLWNLIIAEHLEMLKMGTYRIPDEPRSNQCFPIYQKLDGFDGSIAGRIGGLMGGAKGGRIGGLIGGRIVGRRCVENGHLASLRTPEHQARAGRISIRKMKREDMVRGARKGGAIGGRKTAELLGPEGRAERSRKGGLNGSRADKARAGHIGGRISAPIVNCLRWQIRRGKPCVCGNHLKEIKCS